MIYLIIIGCYLAYFLAQIIYDAFIAKPVRVVNNDDDLNVIQHDHVSNENVDPNAPIDETTYVDSVSPQIINFENVETTKSDSAVDFDDLEDNDEDGVQLVLDKKNQEENYYDVENDNSTSEISNMEENFEPQEEIQPTEVLSKENNQNNFISSFQNFLKGDNAKTINTENVSDDLDVLNIINDATNITSFSYSNVKMI